ncbi:MAG: hypothetical protein ABFD08_13420 [Syntrophomonas sp.]
MKKAKNAAKKMTPDLSALEGIPSRNPHYDYVRMDAAFKARRGAQF